MLYNFLYRHFDKDLFDTHHVFMYQKKLCDKHPSFHNQRKVSRKNRKTIKNHPLRINLLHFKSNSFSKHLFLLWLISKWTFFLITFRHNQNLQMLISPKSLILEKREISWKWWSNSELFEKTWLLQESITHPNTVFAAIVNKSLTFNCSINDVDNTIFF